MPGISEILHSIFTARPLYIAVRLFLAVLFIWAGISKLLEPDNFAAIIDEFDILSTGLVRPAAYALPILEILAGIGLVFDVGGSLAVIAGMMAFFIAVVSYGIWEGIDVDCGCFGLYDPETSLFGKLKPALVRDIILLVPIVYLYWFRSNKKQSAVRCFNPIPHSSATGGERDS